MDRIIVIGLGSMGNRRMRLLKQKGICKECIIGIDAKEERQQEAYAKLGINVCSSIEAALNKYNDVSKAFVSTSPLSHNAIINECLSNGLNVFTEINLVDDGYEANQMLAEDKDKVLFLSSTFLYRKEIGYIQQQVKRNILPLNYMYHTGQFLPDWHPWENYKDFFVGDKRTNGCRELFAIELPWITEVFGEIKSVNVVHDKRSSLKLNYDDNYLVEIIHETGHRGMMAVDVICQRPVRNLEIYNEAFYLSWDGTPFGLKVYDKEENQMKEILLYDTVQLKEGYQQTVIEDAYLAEIEDFFAVVDGKAKQKYGFAKDKKIIKWIDQIEA